MANNKFVGSGYIFPIILNDQGRPEPVNDITLIEASIKNIMYWKKHRRFFVEYFGTRIEDLLEEPNDSITRSLLNTFVKEALDAYEKRIQVTTVTIIKADYVSVSIEVRYRIRTTKIEETFIFPYYKELN